MSQPAEIRIDRPASVETATRYAYIKNGDIIEQYQRYREQGRVGSGPDAFVSEFLEHCAGSPLLLLSRSSGDRRLQDGSVTARVYGDGVRGGPLARIAKETASFAGTLRRLVAFKPHVVLCGRSGPMLWASGIAARLMGTPLIHARHTRVSLASPLGRAIGAVDNFFIRRASGVVCHGPFLRDQLLDVGVEPSRIHEFDVALQPPPPIPGERALPGIPDDAHIVLYVGRIKRSKGVLDLFDACLPVVSGNPAVHLVFVGHGPDFETLSQRASRSPAAARIHLTGQLPQTAIAPIMHRAAVLVTPTRHAIEGRSMAVMEGLVMGLPVIAPDSGPFPYLVGHGDNGLLYRTDSTADLRRQIERVVADPALRDTLAAGARLSGEALLSARPLTFVGAVRAALDGAT